MQYDTNTNIEINQQHLREYLNAQIEEIYKYKWCLGIMLHRDPLELFSLNDIFIMWIEENAINFRNEWIQVHGSGYI